MPEVTLWQLNEPFWPAPRGVRTSRVSPPRPPEYTLSETHGLKLTAPLCFAGP